MDTKLSNLQPCPIVSQNRHTAMGLGSQNPGLMVNLQMKEAAPYKLSFPGGIALLKSAVLY